MINKSLGRDYVSRSKKRLKALEALYLEEAWADVVRESQEVVELALKGMLRLHGLEFPRIHDVSSVIELERSKLRSELQGDLDQFIQISRDLRRDRELAFYGSEDLTPEDFYKESDAQRAMQSARFVVTSVFRLLEG